MRRSTPYLIAALMAATVPLSSFLPDAVALAKTAKAPATTVDIPEGIRLGIVRIPKPGAKIGSEGGWALQFIAFGGSNGQFFYLLAPGADCVDACLQRWKPALADKGARPAGDWTLLGRGKKQWAFQGKPAYTRVDGPGIEQPSMISEARADRPPDMGVLLKDDGEDGMHLALVQPQSWTKMPFSIGVAEYRLAPGQILAAGVAGNNFMGRPLYAFSGTPEQEQKLPDMFKPQYAAALNLPIGEFTIRARTDGTRQWMFRGAPLYTCTCDLSDGDLNGKGAAEGIAPAMLLHYPMPPQVAIKEDKLSVGYLVEASTGKTLYFRDRMKDQYVPNHARPMEGTLDPGMGVLLNTKHCDAQCEKDWHPLWAPRNAKPAGYWSVYVRAGGKRQWAYKNAALYTHAKEGPGSLDGNENYVIAFNDGVRSQPVPAEFHLGLAWRAVVP